MNTQSSDTHPNIEGVQVSLIRDSTIAQRISRVRSLTSTTVFLSKRAIKRANPNLSEKELDLKFVSYHYGKDLATRLREYLENRRL